MLGAMRTLALDYLFIKLGEDKSALDDLENWYQDLRKESSEKLFPYLVEDPESINDIFVIHQPSGCNYAEVYPQEMTSNLSKYLPFVKQHPREPQIGPIFKRNYSKAKGVSPKQKTLDDTIKNFRKNAKSGKKWANYFNEIITVLENPKIKLFDGTIVDWTKNYNSLLECIIEYPGNSTKTILITVKDLQGKFPGERKEYIEYLINGKLAGNRYLTDKINKKTNATCPLCGKSGNDIYPNALIGAGLNFKNVDRPSAFPGFELSQAWKGYSLCVSCADLLYVYKYHVLKKTGPKKDITRFTTQVAGEKALIIPFSTLDSEARQELLKDVMGFIREIPTDVEGNEETLLDLLKEEKALLNLTFLWAEIGQEIKDVKGIIIDIPPSRLQALSILNEESRTWRHPLFPKIVPQGEKLDFKVDLSLKGLGTLFFRAGLEKAKNTKENKLIHIKRSIVAAVYHKRKIPEERFWDEIMITARILWLQAFKGKEGYKDLLEEGRGKKRLCLASWIRHLTWWIYYLRCMEVLPMSKQFYEPELEFLKPYCGPKSGIDSLEKAFAFLLGVLYGKVMEVQGAKGFNVSANALTWLKRLTLTGKDLPELYNKIREKLLAYDTDKSANVRSIINEIGKIVSKMGLGDAIELSQTLTSYYLLIGQSMTQDILPKEKKGE
jgi:CRISPR-associated protein Csh1